MDPYPSLARALERRAFHFSNLVDVLKSTYMISLFRGFKPKEEQPINHETPREDEGHLPTEWRKRETKTLLERLRSWDRGLRFFSLLMFGSNVASQSAPYSQETINDIGKEITESAEIKASLAIKKEREYYLELARRDIVSLFYRFNEMKGKLFILDVVKEMAQNDPAFILEQLDEFSAPNGKLPDGFTPIIESALLQDPRTIITAEHYPHLPEILEQTTQMDLDRVKQLYVLDGTENQKERAAVLLQDLHDGRLTPEAAMALAAPEKQQDWIRRVIKIKAIPNHLASSGIDSLLTNFTSLDISTMDYLHDEPADVRFERLNERSAEEIYTLIAYSGDATFPSTYLGLFDHLMKKMSEAKITGDVLLASVGENRSRTFMRLALQYNRFNEFLETMPLEKQRQILRNLVKNLEALRDPVKETGIVAEIPRLIEKQALREVIAAGVKQEYERVVKQGHENGIVLYGLLSTIVANKAPWLSSEAHETYRLPDASTLDIRSLENAKRTIVERYYFYDDEDGWISYKNFLSRFEHNDRWKIEKHKGYVVLSAEQNGRTLRLYANHPSYDGAQKEDGSTRPDLVSIAMKKEGIEPSVVVHRGHYYHNEKTIDRIPASAKVVVIGSCGSYTAIESVLQKAPDAQIISTQRIGTRLINDALLSQMETALLSQEQLGWKPFWDTLSAQAQNDINFQNYVPPDQNIYAQFITQYHRLIGYDTKPA